MDHLSLSEIVIGGTLRGDIETKDYVRASLSPEYQGVYDRLSSTPSPDIATVKSEFFSLIVAAQEAAKKVETKELPGFLKELNRAAHLAKVARDATRIAKDAKQNIPPDLSPIAEWTLPPDEPKSTQLRWRELIEMAPQINPMLVEGLIPESGLVGIGGKPATAKTWVALDMALALASGQQGFWGQPAHKIAPALVCANNMYREGIIERLTKLAKGRGLEMIDLPLIVEFASFDMASNAGLDLLTRTIEKNQIEVVFLDVLLSYLPRSNYKEGSEMSAVLGAFRARLEQFGTTGVFVHHGIKKHEGDQLDRAFGGAIQIVGELEMAYEAVPYRGGCFKYEQVKNRHAEELGWETVSLESSPEQGTMRLRWGDIRDEAAIEFLERLVTEQGEITGPEARDALGAAGYPNYRLAWDKLTEEINQSPKIRLDSTNKTHVVRAK